MSHKCPATGCNQTIHRDEILMCRKHWFELPRAHQQAVYDSYDKFGGGIEHIRNIQWIIEEQAVRTGAYFDE